MTVLWVAILGACGTTEPTSPEGAAANEPTAIEAPAPAPAVPTLPEAAVKSADGRLNLNAATKEQLEAIPGITPKLVHEFEEYRPYVSIQQFRAEIGKYVDEEMVASFEPHVFVPVNPENADPATFQQLGLSAEQAETMANERPYGREAFMTALAEQLTPEQLEVAKTLLTHE